LRHRFLTISFHPEEAERLGWKIRWWDFLFYLSFGVVITLAVPVAGVLMVFSFLVVPAVIAFLFTRDMRRLAYISWGSGALASLTPLRPATLRFDGVGDRAPQHAEPRGLVDARPQPHPQPRAPPPLS